MNNPTRAALQRHVEVRCLKQLGGVLRGGKVPEIGCGRGIGTRLILDEFGAEHVDAFDLDPEMVELRAPTSSSRSEPDAALDWRCHPN